MRGVTCPTLGITVLLLAMTSAAQASPPPRSEALSGLEPRSIQSTTSPSRSTAPNSPSLSGNGGDRMNPYNPGTARAGTPNFSLTDRIQIGGGPERGQSQLGVYPVDDTSTGNRVQFLFRLDQEQK